MTVDAIIIQIDNEIKRLKQARALLSNSDGGSHANTTAAVTKAPFEANTRKRRTLSAAARKRIAAAQKARWAKQKAASK